MELVAAAAAAAAADDRVHSLSQDDTASEEIHACFDGVDFGGVWPASRYTAGPCLKAAGSAARRPKTYVLQLYRKH